MINFRKDRGALVIGGHFQGLGLIRSLAERYVSTILIDKEPCIGRTSRYIKHFFKCPNIKEHLSFLKYLTNLSEQYHLKGWTLFPTDDESVFFLSKYKAELQEVYRIPTPEWKIIQTVYNKKISYQIAKNIGIPIPLSFFPENIDDVKQLSLQFPVILKPAIMRDFFLKTGTKVFKASNKDELVRLYKKALTIVPADEIIIQEQIPEVWNNLYSFCPFFKNKKPLAYITAKRIRQHPMDFGHASTFAETIYIPELIQAGNLFLSEIDYYGLCEVEFIRDPRDNQYKFLEVNPRIWGWHTLARRSGVNLPFYLFSDIYGMHTEYATFKERIKWIHLITDLPTSIQGLLKSQFSLSSYLSSIRGMKEYAVFSKNDPLPFITELFLLPYLIYQRGF